ncbi:MAG: TetR/AcrR family transcriptional regulator [Deltaproteobacteria bacterium]|nr:TetR/AcrR family transcriptional regulator [Deltaproteobacteria bacterium]
MGTEKVQTDIRRDQIAQAVLQLISRKGLKGLSVAGVAAEIGLVPSALYRHFRSKDEMVDVALEIIGRRLLENVEAVCREVADPLERLRRLLERQVKLARDNPAIPRIIFSEDAYPHYPERKEKVYRLIKTFLARVEAVVRLGQQNGQIRGDYAPQTVAVLFLGLFQPAAVLNYLSAGRYDIEGHMHRVWPIFREALQREPPLPARKPGAGNTKKS